MRTQAQTWTSDTSRAFDAVAGEYDHTNQENPILRHMRARSFATLRRVVPPGAALLDLGCGPGTDHAAMVSAGYVVTAIDASPHMVRQAQGRAAMMDDARRPVVLCRSIGGVSAFAPASFDAAFSNFGPLNCVPDLAGCARQIHDVLRPGGVLVASVIGRLCPWEIAVYLSRGDLRRAALRFRRGPVAVPLKDGTVWTQYYSPRVFTRVFEAAGFSARLQRGMGVIAPPPYLEAWASRHPALAARLLRWDAAVSGWPGVRAMGDHFLVVLQRS